MSSRLSRLALALTTSALAAGLLVAPTTGAASAAAARAPIDILVLGDSYSAGNGATDDNGAEQTYGPDGCRRSRVNWGEKYAATLRAAGQPVNLVNHACSGGVTADFTSPRVMDTASNKVEATPAGVTTTAQANASLARRDPCNTRAFPDEEFWTYNATNVTPVVVTYDCTRNLRPQADFVNKNVDLVLFTMGGNDAGFSSIVQNCFVPVARTSSGCKTKVDAARALLPQIRQRLLTGIAAIRAHGLRNDAKMVQLGYPYLQQDNDFTLSDPPGYAAGDEVRSLVSQGNAAIAAAVPSANAGHPGQLAFLSGVPEKFSGHEPDATTPVGNAARWINQVGDGSAIEVWYHPNRLGQTAYAQLLAARGTNGAPTGPAVVTKPRVRAGLRVALNRHRVHKGRAVRVKVAVALSSKSRPAGQVIVTDATRHRRLTAVRLRAKDHGKVTFRFRLRHTGRTTLVVTYRDPVAAAVRTTRSVRVVR